LLESRPFFHASDPMIRWPMLPVLAMLSAAVAHAEAPP
jgi:hypothetical protein